ncbi:conserved Plasmodium protein, unknown function [Plasmodium relictum]|uniref:Uncharacterized protein n=1 Tax=Plasmodium relictum TaxID=85471 RepID=A0A1J1HDG2_PLARL|nr:conserved Plasmodium protein, unknown function [Plasmodium relictum]CRH03814.1 conserved Plasmodium protein, unknown function [Plasmodium relictum]
MNYYNKKKRKCKINFIDIELEAFIFGCFLYTWNKIITDNIKNKNNNKSSDIKNGKNKNSINNSNNKYGNISVNNNKSNYFKGNNKRNSNIRNNKKNNNYKNFNNSEKLSYEKPDKTSINDETFHDTSDDEVSCNLNEDFRIKNKIDIGLLNEKLLNFVKINFSLNSKDFYIWHDLYDFYKHIKEEEKNDEIRTHYDFLKMSNNINLHNLGNEKGIINNIDDLKNRKKDIKRVKNKENCIFCDISLNKKKVSGYSKIQKFLHVCTKKVYGNKGFQIVNKCIINIKTFDDSFIHSISIERLFSYICKHMDKNLLFFWFKFLNVLLNVTINKRLMIKIFFFFCIKNLLVSSYFSSEVVDNHEFLSKNVSSKHENSFLSDIIKKYKYKNITKVILNNNYILLQNLFDYFYMICSTRNVHFYDNFFLNIQMINFIYLIQINFFHYYYIKLHKKVQNYKVNHLIRECDRCDKNSKDTIKKKKNNYNKEKSRCQNISERKAYSNCINKNDVSVNNKKNIKNISKKSTFLTRYKKLNDLGLDINKFNKNKTDNQNRSCLNNKNKESGNVNINIKNNRDIHYNIISNNYNINTKYYNNFNIKYHNNANNIYNISNIDYLLSLQINEKHIEQSKNSLFEKLYIEKKECITRNLKNFFKRSYIFLNKYIKNDQLMRQSNIFSFLFDALPSLNLKRNVNNILEPYIFSIFSKYQFIEIYNFIENLKNLYNLKKKKKKNLRNNEQPCLKFLNELQGLNYIYNNLKNDYLILTENLYLEVKGENEKKKKKKDQNKLKYNKSTIQNLIQNGKTDIYKHVFIYKFSSKQINIQHNLFNIYLDCNILNKAYKLVMMDFDFSFSLTAEIIFLFKIYLIELKKNNILYSFEILNTVFHKCFVLLKKYLCNPTPFKLLSIISIYISRMLYDFPFLSKFLFFYPNDKINFIKNNIIINENIKMNHYNDYFCQKKNFSFLNFCNNNNYNNHNNNNENTTTTTTNNNNNKNNSNNSNNNNNNNDMNINNNNNNNENYNNYCYVDTFRKHINFEQKELFEKGEMNGDNEALILSCGIPRYEKNITENKNISNYKNNIYDNNNISSDEVSYFYDNIKDYNFLSKFEKLYINKTLKSFNFIFNILERTVNNNDVSLINCSKNNLSSFNQCIFKKQLIHDDIYNGSLFNINNFIKGIVNKLEYYFSTNFKKKNLQNHIKTLDKEKYRNLFYDSKFIISLKYSDENSHFFSLEFLFLAYVCSNYFSDNISNNYKHFLKTFNFNEIWLSNHQIKVKILLCLIYMLLYEINLMNLKDFFFEILKIIIYRFYIYLDYNDLQICQFIFLNLSNNVLFPTFGIIDNIKNVIQINTQSFKEFFYVYHLSKDEALYQYQDFGERKKKEKDFINDFLNYFLSKNKEIENNYKLLNDEIYNELKSNDQVLEETYNINKEDINELISSNNKIYNVTKLCDKLMNEAGFNDTNLVFNETINNKCIISNERLHNDYEIEDKHHQDDIYTFTNNTENGENTYNYSFDYFSSEQSLEQSDFVFFKKNRHNEKGESLGSNFLNKIITQINKKATIKKKNVIVDTSEKNYSRNKYTNLIDDIKSKKKEFISKKENLKKKISYFTENKIEVIYEMILNYFKIQKEIYIDNYVNKKYESIVSVQEHKSRLNYYENVQPEYYEFYYFQKTFCFSEELCETDYFIFALNKNMIKSDFSLKKKRYIYFCLNLLTIIDLYMEFNANIYNKIFYFIKNLIITCANISFCKKLTIIYINSLIRLCLFEIRMNNFFVSSNILVEILNNFEKIKEYKNLIGTIFYLCGYLLLQKLNYDDENLDEEKNILINEYYYYANLKKNSICSIHKKKIEKCKLNKGNYKRNSSSSEKLSNIITLNDYDKGNSFYESSNCINNYQNKNKNFLKCVYKNASKKHDNIPKNNNYSLCNTGKERLLDDYIINEKKNNSYFKKKSGRKLIPLIKNQIKITDFFSNSKNEKSFDMPFENSNVLDHMQTNTCYRSSQKRRKTNNELSDHVIIQKIKYNSHKNVKKEDFFHHFCDKLNKKQFCLLLICFYIKQALNYWKNEGDSIGIFNGIQQKKRIKDSFFFLMSSYKFFYKSSLFLSKQKKIQYYKCPFFNYELFKTYYKFYIYYKEKFMKCNNENIINLL